MAKKGNGQTKGGPITQIIVAVVVALLIGGSAPWWWLYVGGYWCRGQNPPVAIDLQDEIDESLKTLGSSK